MLSINVQVEFDHDEGLEAGEPLPKQASTKLFEALTEWWVRNAAEPYANVSANQTLVPVSIAWNFLDKEISFEVTFDFNLLENLLQIYTLFGWSALEAIDSVLEDFPNRYQPAKQFFRLTQNVVAVMVAHELIQLEQQVVTYARQKWAQSREKVLEYLRPFGRLQGPLAHKRYTLRDRKLANEVFQLCRDYAVEANKARALQEKIDERNRIDPPSRRRKGSGFELWFEVFAAPQRESLNKMTEYAKQIGKKLPGALLVLDALPELRMDTFYHKTADQNKLEQLIGSTLDSLLIDLQTLEDSLKLPGATAELAESLKPIIAEPRDLSGLAKLKLPKGGFEQTVFEIVLERHKKEDQRLLANLDLLFNFYDDPEGLASGTWSQVVLYQYSLRLAEAIEEMKRDEAFRDTVWRWVGRVTALLSLVALMAIFPFGEAAAPALLSLLALSGSISMILGTLTLLHDVFSTLEKAGKLEIEARDRFFRLAQTDPEAIVQIGEMLTRCKALRDGVDKGLLTSLFTLAASHRLKAVVVALNFQGFMQDVETLFAPVAANE